MADEVYTYQGNPFTTFVGTTCPSVCAISGSFTLSSPIGPDQTVISITPLSFSFTDGSTTFNSSNSVFEDLGFVTDATGNIAFWLFGTFNNNGINAIESENLGLGSTGDLSLGANGSSASNLTAGTWTSAVATPEPSSLFLLGAGLLGLIGLRNRNTAARQLR
jgi:hypothetical protein